MLVKHYYYTWSGWRHQMETFSALGALCAGNSPGTGEFPAQRPVTWSFDVFFDLWQLSKQWRRWWFEMPSCALWRDCNAYLISMNIPPDVLPIGVHHPLHATQNKQTNDKAHLENITFPINHVHSYLCIFIHRIVKRYSRVTSNKMYQYS